MGTAVFTGKESILLLTKQVTDGCWCWCQYWCYSCLVLSVRRCSVLPVIFFPPPPPPPPPNLSLSNLLIRISPPSSQSCLYFYLSHHPSLFVCTPKQKSHSYHTHLPISSPPSSNLVLISPLPLQDILPLPYLLTPPLHLSIPPWEGVVLSYHAVCRLIACILLLSCPLISLRWPVVCSGLEYSKTHQNTTTTKKPSRVQRLTVFSSSFFLCLRLLHLNDCYDFL